MSNEDTKFKLNLMFVHNGKEHNISMKESQNIFGKICVVDIK